MPTAKTKRFIPNPEEQEVRQVLPKRKSPEEKIKKIVDYNQVVRERDYFAMLGIDASGQEFVQNFSRNTIYELRKLLTQSDEPIAIDKTKFAILGKKNSIARFIDVDALPEDLGEPFRQWLEGQERHKPQSKASSSNPLSLIANRIIEEGPERVTAAKNALSALLALSKKAGNHLERYKTAWLDMHGLKDELKPETRAIPKQELTKGDRIYDLLERYFKKCRSESYHQSQEAQKRVTIIPVISKATGHDQDLYFLSGLDLTGIDFPSNADFSNMDLSGAALKLHSGMNIKDAIFGERNGVKTRLSSDSDITHVRGWQENPTFTPENIEGLEPVKGYKPPAIPHGTICILDTPDEEFTTPPRVERARRLDRNKFQEFLTGKNSNHAPVISQYLLREHGDDRRFLVGKDLSQYRFPDGTVFDVDLRGTTFKLPQGANIEYAQFGADERTGNKTQLVSGSVISRKLIGWQENSTFHPSNISNLNTVRYRKLVDPSNPKYQKRKKLLNNEYTEATSPELPATEHSGKALAIERNQRDTATTHSILDEIMQKPEPHQAETETAPPPLTNRDVITIARSRAGTLAEDYEFTNRYLNAVEENPEAWLDRLENKPGLAKRLEAILQRKKNGELDTSKTKVKGR